jgi:hypothetical protein
MVYALQGLHPLDLDSPCLNSLMDFQLDIDVELSLNFFNSIALHMSHLLVSNPLGMVIEHLGVVILTCTISSHN